MSSLRYERGFSFSSFQANQPKKPLPGQRLDIELDEIASRLSRAGASAYELAKLQGFTGTEAEYLASLKSTVPGPPGSTTVSGLTDATAAFKSLNVQDLNAPGNAVSDRTKIGLSRSPWDKGANGLGQADDTAFLQACIDEIQLLQNNQFISHGIIDGRGGTFAISAPLKMTGNPYLITLQNMAIVPRSNFPATGAFFDLSACPTTTKLRFDNLVLNGYDRVASMIKMGPKTQGNTTTRCFFTGFTGPAILDPGTTAAQEHRIVNNVFQGAVSTNQGFAIELYGNDNEVICNDIYNIACGIRLHAASCTIAHNHIYSVDPNQPIPIIYCDTGDQIQIVANYLDQGYTFVKDPSGLQYLSNRILMAGNIPVSDYNPLVLRPASANATFLNVLIKDNLFRNLFPAPIGSSPVYTPVKIDASTGSSVALCYNCHMKDNGFYGFVEQTTEPKGVASGNLATTFAVNLSSKIPFGSLKGVDSIVPVGPGYGAISSVSFDAAIVYVNFSSQQTGSCRVRATVNSD